MVRTYDMQRDSDFSPKKPIHMALKAIGVHLKAQNDTATTPAIQTRSSGKNWFAYFPYISHLFEVLEPNLMEFSLSEHTLTSFNSI
jgi:hypothetical protein